MRHAVAIVLGVLALAGCTGSPEPQETALSPSATASAPRDAVPSVRAPVVLGEVPVGSAALEQQAAPAAAPVRLRIPGLDIDMPVAPVGLDGAGDMEIPESAAVAGWYRFGPAPGNGRGSTVLAAHIDDARIGIGPFGRLGELAPGDHVEVTDAEGVAHIYAVERVEQTSKRQVDMDLVFDRRSEARLALVTCGGRFDWDAGHYEDNVVAWAVPAQGRS